MKIICDTTFLDGRDRFEKDETRVVDDKRGKYFINQGWAHEFDSEAVGPAVLAPVTLDVHSASHAQEATNG